MAKPIVTNKFSSKKGSRGIYIRGVSEDCWRKWQRLNYEAKDKADRKEDVRQSDVFECILNQDTVIKQLKEKLKKVS